MGEREEGVPCIWPMISSLSRRSVPARRRSLPPLAVRNLWLRPVNQVFQKGWVADRLVRQDQGGWVLEVVGVVVVVVGWWRREGTEMRAEVGERIVRVRVLGRGRAG